MKAKTLNLLYVLNILIIPFSIFRIRMGEGFSPESHSIVFSIQLLVGIAYLTFWIYLIRIWYKYDKAIFRLFLIILFNVLYTWYYYSFAKKNGWLNKNADEFEKAVQ